MEFTEALDAREVRRFLGIALVLEEVRELNIRAAGISASQYRLEIEMATAREQLDSLSAKVDDMMADVRAAKATLEQERANLSPEAQDALDQLSAKVDAFDAEIGDADSSDTLPATPADDGGAGVDTGEGAGDGTEDDPNRV